MGNEPCRCRYLDRLPIPLLPNVPPPLRQFGFLRLRIKNEEPNKAKREFQCAPPSPKQSVFFAHLKRSTYQAAGSYTILLLFFPKKKTVPEKYLKVYDVDRPSRSTRQCRQIAIYLRHRRQRNVPHLLLPKLWANSLLHEEHQPLPEFDFIFVDEFILHFMVLIFI